MSIFEFSGFDFYYILFFIFVIGACVGSFANVVILRAFSGESIVLPPSKCPHCHNKLKWYHNIPILSYLALRGKCGFCKKPISVQYPIIEAVVALLFVGVFLKFGLNLNSVMLSVAAMLCVVLSVTDIKEQVIFDGHAYALGFLGLVYNFFDIGNSGLGTYNFTLFQHNITINKSFIFAILGIIAGAVVMEMLAFAGKLFVGKRGFGEGDAFILGALGAVFRVQAVPYILVAGVIVQVLIILPMFVRKLFVNKEYALLVSLAGFYLSVGVFKLLDKLNLLGNLLVFVAAFLVMLGFAIFSCKKLINLAKSGERLTYVPFGPPLVIAALVMMFI